MVLRHLRGNNWEATVPKITAQQAETTWAYWEESQVYIAIMDGDKFIVKDYFDEPERGASRFPPGIIMSFYIDQTFDRNHDIKFILELYHEEQFQEMPNIESNQRVRRELDLSDEEFEEEQFD